MKGYLKTWELWEVQIAGSLSEPGQIVDSLPLRFEWHEKSSPPTLYEVNERGEFYSIPCKSDGVVTVKVCQEKPLAPPHPRAKGEVNHAEGNSS